MSASGPPRPPSSDEVRQHIISSLFTKKDADGTPEETLISYLKVYEQDEGGGGAFKTRYLMLAVTRHGKVVVHKAKRNNNLSFSKGKTWNLEDVRALEVISGTDFALTMTIRRYHWQTEKSRDQTHFLNSVVKVYRTYTKSDIAELIGWTPPPPPPAPASQNGSMGDRRPSSSSHSPLPRGMDLAPPPGIKTQRSGSSSSVLSAQSSRYDGAQSEASFSRSRSRPSMDEPRSGSFSGSASALGRSPLSDSALGGRRPSGNERIPSPAHGSNTPGSSGASSGSGRKEERLGDNIRKASAASDYEIPSQRRRPSNGDGMASIEEGTRRISIDGDKEDLLDTPKPLHVINAMDTSSNEHPRTNGNGERKSIPPPLQPRSQLAPIITTTLPSPSVPQEENAHTPKSAHTPTDRKITRRKSFHPAPVSTAFSREVLLTSRTGLLPGAPGLNIDADKDAAEDALLGNVEEMLEGFEWTAAVGSSVKKGSADAIESRLLDELAALDSANIHAFLESDDRIAQVLGHIDEALTELDDMDMQITGYRMQLNAVSEDISYIESQNRGLQVQTSNQQALLNELRQLLQIVEVPQEDLRTLTQESPGTQRGVQVLERAAASLYKALQAGMDQANAEVAATIARMDEYKENSAQFSKRIYDYLDVTFKYQSDQTLSDSRKSGKNSQGLNPHTSMCEYLMMYEGLVLYVKEMDEDRYQKLCSNYMSTISSLHRNEIKDILMNLMGTLNATAGGEPNEASFASAASSAPKPSALAKSRAVVGLKGEAPKKERRGEDNAHRVSELYENVLTQIVNQVLTEEGFINAFLHLTDAESTFADHMELDSYFRRMAARHAARQMSPGLMQLVRSMMDLVFGFIDQELKQWIEAACERNAIAVVGVLSVTERLAKEAEEEKTSLFFAQLFDRQLARQRAALDAFANDQIRIIENSRNTIRKRRGVAFFVRHFPTFVEKMEAQLADATGLSVRSRANDVYERVVNTIFSSVQQLAKMDRGDALAAEDKGQINYHVIMIENLHHFVDDLARLQVSSLGAHLERARGLYEENMQAYVKTMLRRSFSRMIDFFDGVERLLKTTPAAEVSLHNSYSRSALKKMLKDNGAKDMRKAIETMSKRVDKHFTDEEVGGGQVDTGTQVLISTVWREVTSGLKHETERARVMIGKSYGDSGLGLEYGPGDVDAACKRAK